MERKNFIQNYGDALGKSSFFGDKFGVVKDGYDINRKSF